MAPEAGLGGAALLAAGGSLERVCVRVCAHDMCVHTCAYVRMAAHLRVYMCACMHVRMCACTRECVLCMCAIYVCACMCVHTCVQYTCAHMCVCVHVCARARACGRGGRQRAGGDALRRGLTGRSGTCWLVWDLLGATPGTQPRPALGVARAAKCFRARRPEVASVSSLLRGKLL